MSTISVPLTAALEGQLEELISQGYAASKAEVMRKALMKASEDEAVRAVLEAERDPRILRGDLRTLAKRFPAND